MIRCLAAAALAALAAAPAMSQTAAERAAVLKQWRADCASSDPELRLAYVEDAVVNQGAVIGRLCARATLASKDPDTRALGLRAALMLNQVMSFPIEMPLEYQNKLQAAEASRDEDAVKALKSAWRYTIDAHEGFGGTLAFQQKKVSLDGSTSEWLMKGFNGSFSDNWKAMATATADSLRIEGSFPSGSLTLDLRLGEGGVLSGTAVYDGKGPFPVIAELL